MICFLVFFVFLSVLCDQKIYKSQRSEASDTKKHKGLKLRTQSIFKAFS